MLLRSLSRSALAALMVLATGLALTTQPVSGDSRDKLDAQPAAESGSQFITYARQYGETYFALSLAAPEKLPRAETTDVLVLFDTSASQTGVYRDDALAMLDSFLAELADSAQVKLGCR